MSNAPAKTEIKAAPEAEASRSAIRKVEIQLTREEVLELQCLEERSSRLQAQMQLLTMQAQQLQTDIQKVDKDKKELLERIESIHGHNVSRFSVDVKTCIASGMAAR